MLDIFIDHFSPFIYDLNQMLKSSIKGLGVVEDIPLNQKSKTKDYQYWMLEDVIKS